METGIMLGMPFLRVLSVWVVAAVAASSVAAGQAQDAAGKAAAILAETRKALGGEDRLAAVQRLEAKGTVRRAAGDVTIDGDLEIAIELPDKYLRKESVVLGGGGQGFDRKEVLNGSEAWEEMKFGGGVDFGDGDPASGGDRGPAGRAEGRPADAPAAAGTAPQDDPAAQLRARQTEVARVLFVTLLTSSVPARWIGTAVSPQATAEVLEIRTPDGAPTRLLVDSRTYMPLMLTWTGLAEDPLAALAGRAGFGRGRRGRGGFAGGFPGRGGFPDRGGQRRRGAEPDPGAAATRADALAQPTAVQMFLSDYKTVNGIKLPHLMVRGAGDRVTEEWVIRNYRVNPGFKADTFSR